MADAKQDLYAFLGIAKTASEEEIKKACKKAIIKNDPDRFQDAAGKETARANYKLAVQAQEVLLDKKKRAAYDAGGYKGLENIGTSSTGPSFTGNGSVTKIKTNVDPFDYFGKIADKQDKTDTPPPVKQVDLDEAARKRRERMKKMSGGASTEKTGGSDSSDEKPSCITDAFRVALQTVKGDMALFAPFSSEPSVGTLDRLIQNLDTLSQEAKTVRDRARKNEPKP